MDTIAQATWWFSPEHAPQQEIRVSIGQPEQQAHGSWTCALSATGAFPGPVLLSGRDSFQAVARAVLVARATVADMAQRIELTQVPGGEPVDWERYFSPTFGRI